MECGAPHRFGTFFAAPKAAGTAALQDAAALQNNPNQVPIPSPYHPFAVNRGRLGQPSLPALGQAV